MAKSQRKVYLGYEEELIAEKSQSLTKFTDNKIGGFPDWPSLDNSQFSFNCPLCGLHRLLIVQCYAPIEKSLYHRTLYIFACINPNCWIQSESWLCVRIQVKDNLIDETSPKVALPKVESNLTWCGGANDWDENYNGDTANGNFMNVDNIPSPNIGIQRNSDEDEESNSFEVESVEQALGNLQMYDAHNANTSPLQGAVGDIGVPMPAAELEGGDEPGLVIVDSPTAPASDIESLLLQTAELPHDIRSRLLCGPLQFIPKYIYVEEEWLQSSVKDDRTTELLNKYSKENEIDICGGGERVGGGSEDEVYEEATPLHGDKLFHAFLTRLSSNPGQILRYSRECPPVVGAPLGGHVACSRCGAHTLAELHLVPAFADTLRLAPHNTHLSHLHFLSVLVFTCSQSCWQPTDTFVKETVLFQPEV